MKSEQLRHVVRDSAECHQCELTVSVSHHEDEQPWDGPEQMGAVEEQAQTQNLRPPESWT